LDIFQIMSWIKIFVVILFFPFFGSTQVVSDTSLIYRTVYFLAEEENEGRRAGTEGEVFSAQFIETELKQLGIEPFLHSFSHSFPVDFQFKNRDGNIDQTSFSSLNVIGEINVNKEKTIVIGAHYDHLGRNEFGTAKDIDNEHRIRPGADDNASGVALVLQMANYLQTHKNELNSNIIFAFFSSEEIGLQGSKAFLNQLKENDLVIHTMLNFDMVGKLSSEKKLFIDAAESAKEFNTYLKEIGTEFSFTIETNEEAIGGSDHLSFCSDSISAVSISTGIHEDYHTANDTPDKINFSGIAEIAEFSLALVNYLGTRPITFQPIQIKQSTSRSSLNVSLGIMPGYGTSNGLLIEAVTVGKTAHLFDLQKGDRIIQINDCTVSNIHEYMSCLKGFHPGDEANITLVRKEKEIIKTIIFK